MKTQISRWSDDPAKRRSGIYQQQGRMITDADLNELVELLKRRVDDALGEVVGSGAPRSNPAELVGAGPLLRPGVLYADGVRARLEPASAGATSFALTAQADFPGAPLVPGGASEHVLYADLWELPTSGLQEAAQLDPGLHGADTSTRTQMLAQVKWCPSATIPDPVGAAQNPRKGDATAALAFRAGQAEADPCDPCAAEIALDARVGNYLFRVEVHDVRGTANAPNELVLKWSSENGAEQHAAASAPADYKRGDWIYEFYSDTTERHLGVHLASGFAPQRAVLKDGWPASLSMPELAGLPYVRRWDGFAVLTKSGGSWSMGSTSRDKGRAFILLPGGGTPTHGHFTLTAAELVAHLSGLKLTLALNKKFVAGDFWLATVRENTEEAARVQQTSTLPIGIEHHYVVLARVVGGVVQSFSDADRRRLSFPTLANLTAERVGYDPALKAARWDDILETTGDAARPKNVQTAIDALIDGLESTDVSFLVPTCGTSTAPTVRSLLGAALTGITDTQGRAKLDALLNLFLCSFNAGTVPFTNNCPRLFATTTNTVQQALNDLCNLDAERVPYTNASDPAFSSITNVKLALDRLLPLSLEVAIPKGTVMTFAAPTPPAGWLECNGFAMSRTTYSALFAVIGTRYGGGDGATTFNLPNLRGEFVRGWDNGRGEDPGRALASWQDHQLQNHVHSDPGHTHSASTAAVGTHAHSALASEQIPERWPWGDIMNDGGAGGQGWPSGNNHQSFRSSDRGRVFNVPAIQGAGAHNHAVSVAANFTGAFHPATGNHGAETRPRNVALMYCIKH